MRKMSSFARNCVRKRVTYGDGDAFPTHALQIQGLICQVGFRIGQRSRMYIEPKTDADAVLYYYVTNAVTVVMIQLLKAAHASTTY